MIQSDAQPGGRRQTLCAAILSAFLAVPAAGQQLPMSNSQSGAVSGTVTDVNGDAISGAVVILESSVPVEKHSARSGDTGSFAFENLTPSIHYHVTISADGFVPWVSPAFTVSAGQHVSLTGSTLRMAEGAVSVTVYSSAQPIAVEQVKNEERQRAFGVIPNFYVVYDHAAAPLTGKLKFNLALKASTDPVIFAAVALVAGAEQASDTPDYEQGAKGYGQRVGALYANGFADIMIGEAILPSLLHQDPRYFYQGTGSIRSRALHALSSPFICKADNGRWEPNYSSIGGDLAAGAISNLYSPQSNRGSRIVFEDALITTSGRMVSGLAQEFILRRFTQGENHRVH